MLISPDEIQKSLSSKGWKYAEKQIVKYFSFEKYLDGIEFVTKIAELAEAQNHHPEMTIGYSKVDISISSHDLGGVSTKCVNLALGIDRIFEGNYND